VVAAVVSLVVLGLAASPALGEQPLTALPYTPALDASFMDRSVDPALPLLSSRQPGLGRRPADRVPAGQDRAHPAAGAAI